MGPPAIRAAVMVSIFLFADLLGRQKSAMTAIGFAAAVMAAITRKFWRRFFPADIFVGGGYCFDYARLQTWVKRLSPINWAKKDFFVSTVNWMADSLCVTLGVTIAIWPLLVYYFGFSPCLTDGACWCCGFAVPARQRDAAAVSDFLLPIGRLWVAGMLAASYMLLVINGFAKLTFFSNRRGTISPL